MTRPALYQGNKPLVCRLNDAATDLRRELREAQAQRDEAIEKYKKVRSRLQVLDANVTQDHWLSGQVQGDNAEAFKQGTMRNLALQLGEAIVNSPFAVINTRRVEDDKYGPQLVTNVSVTLFKPNKKGSKDDG